MPSNSDTSLETACPVSPLPVGRCCVVSRAAGRGGRHGGRGQDVCMLRPVRGRCPCCGGAAGSTAIPGEARGRRQPADCDNKHTDPAARLRARPATAAYRPAVPSPLTAAWRPARSAVSPSPTLTLPGTYSLPVFRNLSLWLGDDTQSWIIFHYPWAAARGGPEGNGPPQTFQHLTFFLNLVRMVEWVATGPGAREAELVAELERCMKRINFKGSPSLPPPNRRAVAPPLPLSILDL